MGERGQANDESNNSLELDKKEMSLKDYQQPSSLPRDTILGNPLTPFHAYHVANRARYFRLRMIISKNPCALPHTKVCGLLGF